MKPLAAKLTYDGMGSVIAQLDGSSGSTGPRIMVDAHMDELGGMVRRVTANGFLTMQMLGGWLDQALVDQRWIILGSRGPVHAITGIRDIHVLPTEDRNKVFPRDSLFLDVGAKDAAGVAALGIGPGDPVVPDSPFLVLNGTDNYLGKAWDDRIGCAVLLEAMQRLAKLPHANQLFFVATTQEEIGLRGAKTAADAIRPDIGLAIEGGIAGDTYPGHPEETQVKLGAGPGVFLYDTSALPKPQAGGSGEEDSGREGYPAAARSGAGLRQRFFGDPGELRRCANAELRCAGALHARPQWHCEPWRL